MNQPRRSWSIRIKLVLAALAVELTMLTVLVANSMRVIEEAVVEQTVHRVSQIKLLMNAALAPPLAQRDHAALQKILEQAVGEENFSYLALEDHEGKVVAAAGWDLATPLPPPDRDLRHDDEDSLGRYDDTVPIRFAGRVYGKLHFGVSTRFLDTARQRLLRQSLLIAGPALLLSAALLTLLGYFITRHLAALTRASHAVAQGEFDVTLPMQARDEVGTLASAFDAMARAIREKLEETRKSEAKFHAIADHSHNIECWFGATGRLIWVSPSVEHMTGYAPEECLAMKNFPIPLIAGEDMEQVMADSRRAIRQATSGSGYEFRVKRKDEAVFWASNTWQPIYGSGGEYLGIRTSIHDVSQLKAIEFKLLGTVAELQQAQVKAKEDHARLTALLSAMNIGILLVGGDSRAQYYNPAFTRILMIHGGENLMGRTAQEMLSLSASAPTRPEHFLKHVLQAPDPLAAGEPFEIQMTDGRVLTQISYPVREDGERLIGRLWLFEDVTRERQTAEQLIYLAERDSLTGLYNRHRFQEELSRMVLDAERRDASMALLFFDLDDFKYVNDTYGHRAGDAILIRVAGEVATQVRRNEILCRLGGDEFAILAPEANEPEMQALAERIVRTIGQIPFRYEDRNLRLTSSVGIALYPEHAFNLEELVAHADAAMYQAKEAGKNVWRSYRHDLEASRQIMARLTWNERIGNALEKGLMRVYFQGVYRTFDRTLSHLEALVRMVDDQNPKQLIMPGHFIPVAEKSGKILDIDRWVIAESIRMLAQSPDTPPIAVNISGRSFDEPSLPQFIADELQRRHVEPQRLLVELTETSAVSDLHDARRFIEALRKTGCMVCLDDFGSGFSSFAYLKLLNVDMLKIDGLFIRDLPNDRDNQVFVKAIVDVARGMRKVTVAEFVEDADTLDMLKGFGVNLVQGYHLDIPQGDHPALQSARSATPK